MMEFTYSRVALVICGAILLSAFASPISGIYANDYDERMDALAQKDARLIDAFWESDVDELILNGDAMLPSAGYSLTVEGTELTIFGPDGKEYTAALHNETGSLALSYGQKLSVFRN